MLVYNLGRHQHGGSILQVLQIIIKYFDEFLKFGKTWRANLEKRLLYLSPLINTIISWLHPLKGFEIIFLLRDIANSGRINIVSKPKRLLSLSRVSLLRWLFKFISWCSLLYLYQTNLTKIILSHLILIRFSEGLADVHSCGRTVTDFFLRKYLEGIYLKSPETKTFIGFYFTLVLKIHTDQVDVWGFTRVWKTKFHSSIIGDTKTCSWIRDENIILFLSHCYLQFYINEQADVE